MQSQRLKKTTMNTVTFQNVYQTITARGEFKLGERGMTPDGREWTFVSNGSTIVNGNIVVPAAVVDTDLWSSSTDNQSRIVYVNRAANSLTVGEYEDAIGYVNEGTGAGQTFKIRTNSATQLTLYPETALVTALAVVDSDLMYIGMSKVVIAAVTSKVQMTQGAFQVAAVSGDFGWILVNGDGRAVTGEALTIGGGFNSGDDTTGQVVKNIATESAITAQPLGYAIMAGATDQAVLVRYNIR